MNLSRISSQSYFGKILRAPLRLIPGTAVFPILQGPLRGKKWIVGSSTHGCWLGSYERDKQRAMQRAIHRGDVIYDIGANVGFYTMLSSVLTGAQGCVYAFEPLPRNLRDLREHLKINRISNCVVVEAAVAEKDGEARLDPSVDRCQGRLSATGALAVRTVALDSFVGCDGVLPPSIMKIDIEGAEAECLRGAAQTIAGSHPIIFLATHGAEVHAACLRLLSQWGYRVRALDGQPVEHSCELIAEPPPGSSRT